VKHDVKLQRCFADGAPGKELGNALIESLPVANASYEIDAIGNCEEAEGRIAEVRFPRFRALALVCPSRGGLVTILLLPCSDENSPKSEVIVLSFTMFVEERFSQSDSHPLDRSFARIKIACMVEKSVQLAVPVLQFDGDSGISESCPICLALVAEDVVFSSEDKSRREFTQIFRQKGGRSRVSASPFKIALPEVLHIVF